MNILIETAQLLEKGASIIEEKGWCQLQLQKPTGEVCVFGSLLLAQGFPAEEHDEHWWSGDKASPLHQSIVNSLINEIYPSDPGVSLDGSNLMAAGLISTRWNDSPNQSAHNVITTMRSAAQRLYERDRT